MMLAVTVFASILLVGLDGFILTVMFLYQPTWAEILAGVMLAGALAAFLLRWRWLFLASQNVVTAVTLLRLLQWEGPKRATDLIGPILFVLLLAVGNLLAWYLARAIPPRRGGPQRTGTG